MNDVNTVSLLFIAEWKKKGWGWTLGRKVCLLSRNSVLHLMVVHQDLQLLITESVSQDAKLCAFICRFGLTQQNVRGFSGSFFFNGGGLCGIRSHAGGVQCHRILLRLGQQGPRKLQGLPNRGAKTDSPACLHVPGCQLHVIYNRVVQPGRGKAETLKFKC